ncbi:MAG: ABC transporter permease [Chitinophagales bacterium]|nr:ABC transporter permease [Chitinophagales bacterium]
MEKWTEEISPQHSLLDLKLKEVWRYKDLLLMFVKRDFVTFYKQTILGPLWFFVQPLLTSLMFLIIFGRIANISTGGVPQIVFYLSGVTLWNYFAECLNKTATVFKDNASIFGKVYFPRLVMPLSIVVSNLIRFGIQFFLFLLIWAWYYWQGSNLQPNTTLLLIPYLLLLMAVLALGLGMIISSLTTKYKDLIFLLTFGVQLLMYATPIIYPLSEIQNSSPTIAMAIKINPLSAIVETFRYAFTGSGSFSWVLLGYSSAVAFFVLAIGAIIFNKVEKSFMDTV